MPEPHADPSFALKITPPRARRMTAQRGWLARNCAPLRNGGIGLVHAPGGFGKTTLLVELRRELLAQGASVGWLLVDRRDDGARFVAGLVASLRIATGNPHFGTIAAQAAKQPRSEFDALTALLADVIELARPVAILLDDVHALPQRTSDELVVYLLHNRPPNLSIMLGTRVALPLVTGELNARGELVVVTSKELRLTLEETIEFLRARLGRTTNLDSCARVHDIAEGWPIAVQLMASLIESDPAADLGGIAAGSRDVDRFFEETVLSRMSAEEADFVVACAALDAMHPGLCRAMTGNVHAAAMLEQLQRTTPILSAIEGDVWVRMHPLARSAFARRFDDKPLAERQSANWRAAQWLHDKGDPVAASRHALAAGRTGEAYAWMAAHMYALSVAGNVSEVLAWARRLPEDVIASPRVRLAVGWASMFSYQLAVAGEHADALAADAEAAVRFEADLIRAGLAIYADDLALARRAVEHWGDDPPFDLPHLRQVHANIASYLTLDQGDSERARYQQATARVAPTEFWRGMPKVLGDLVNALSYLWEGRPVLAEEVARPTLDRMEVTTGRRSVASCTLAPPLAMALWEQDRRDQAESILAYRVDVVEQTGVPVAVALAYVVLARLALAAGHEARGLAALEQLHALGVARRQPRLVVASLCEQVRIQAALRRSESCELVVERLDKCLGNADGEGSYGAVRELAHARMLIAGSDVERARQHLVAARNHARKQRRTREWLEARVLLATFSDPRDAEAVASLRESLSIAEANGLVRVFADAHPQALEAVRAFAGERPPDDVGASSSFVARVLGEAPESWREVAPPRKAVAAPALLTAKEAAILEFLSRGMSNKEIARAVDAGQETVKWHLKNLFGKLQAGSRRHAVDRARALGLLPE